MNKVYQIITDKMLEALRAGEIPWRKPWKNSRLAGLKSGGPVNIRGTAYHGINKVLLNWEMTKNGYKHNVWLTPNQAIEMKGEFKGQKTTLVTFWKFYEKENDKGKKERFASLRYYNVLNIEQVNGIELPKKFTDEPTPEPAPKNDPIETAESIVKEMPNAPEIRHGGNEAFYSHGPYTDYVQMPDREQFVNSAEYYAVLFHELTHSTGHTTRLGRFDSQQNHHFGSEDYSKEELTAEMGCNFLCSETGIDHDFNNSVAYIQTWIKKLENNPTWIVSAASKAEKSTAYILGMQTEEPAEEETDATA